MKKILFIFTAIILASCGKDEISVGDTIYIEEENMFGTSRYAYNQINTARAQKDMESLERLLRMNEAVIVKPTDELVVTHVYKNRYAAVFRRVQRFKIDTVEVHISRNWRLKKKK